MSIIRRSCAVLGCPNKGIHYFPIKNALREKWCQALRLHLQCEDRSNLWQLRKYSKICSDHFKPSDFNPAMPDSSSRIVPKSLKRNAIPSLFPWTCHGEGEGSSTNPTQVNKTYSKPVLPTAFAEEILCVENTFDAGGSDPLEIPSSEDYGDHDENENRYDNLSPQIENINNICDFPEIVLEDNNHGQIIEGEEYDEKLLPKMKADKYCQINNTVNPAFSIHTYKHDDKAIHFYTGLQNFKKLFFVFQTLGDSSKLNYYYDIPVIKNISPLDQFFLTLIILRQHFTFEQISMMFLKPIKQIYSIFITWVRFMALQWRRINIWPGRDIVHAYAPLDFHDNYPMTRVVLDATEFPIKKPKLPLAQQITFSSYKNRNTAKVIIGITPGGLISYVSPCYGGSATDRQIIERSNILNKFDFNDEIMVDKGLNVQDIFIGYGVKVNMPSFFKKSNQINPNTLVTDRKIASKRVHVERVIGMLKTYKILKQPMNKTETILCCDIVYICAMLVNFRSNIIKNTA